jgi:hypothetical protein
MPTLEHDGVVALFRDNPPLALRVLEDMLHVPLPAHAAIRVADTSLDQMLPIEFRADLVLEVLDAENRFVLAIVLESQREIKNRKKYSWPVYVTVSRAERECPAILMVIAVDEEVAGWAEQHIDLGVAQGTVKPVVLGPRTIPEITDEQAARQDAEVALLSGMAHGNGTNGAAVIQATLAGIKTLDREAAMVYFQVLWNVLRKPMQAALMRLVMEQRSTQREFPFVKEIGKYIGESYFREGEAKGYRDGEVKATREKILRAAQRRGLVLSDEQQERIRGCEDRQTLDGWFDNVLDAMSGDEVFR